MVQGLKWFRWRSGLHGFITGLTLFLPTTLTGCTGLQSVTQGVSDYCQISSGRYPILLSRHDTEQTKRQVAILNTTYERVCSVKEMK